MQIIRNGKYFWQQHPLIGQGRVTVSKLGDVRSYDVFVDGKKIGNVRGEREMSSKIYKGRNIRYDLGHPLVWRVNGSGRFGIGKTTRLAAIIELLHDWEAGVAGQPPER